MVDVLPRSERRVQFHRRSVAGIRLHEDYPRAVGLRHGLQMPNQARGNSLSPVRLGNGEVIDVDLAALLLELLENICRQSAGDLVAVKCDDDDEVVLTQQLPNV